MKRSIYIFLFLLIAANIAAQEEYVIDLVCAGTDRVYRIDTKEKGSRWEWYLKDSLGIEIDQPVATDFWEESSPGDTTWGSEINITWNDIGKFYLSTLHFSSHGCDTLEQGWVEVFDPPVADAGQDIIACLNDATVLTTDSAWHFSSVFWASNGDGFFDDFTKLHPTYSPGKADGITGSVILILTANGKTSSMTCTPDTDSMMIRYSNPAITLSFADLLCYNDSSGWAMAKVSGGIEPYKFNWTGPGLYTSTSDSIFALAAGMYIITVTDSIGCSAADTVVITEPLQLLTTISADVQLICDDDSIHLKAEPNGGTGNYAHLWTGTGAIYLNHTDSISPYFAGANTGVYKLLYTVTDENGCTAIDSMDLTVLPKDTITYDTIICGNEVPYAWYGKNYFTSDIYIDTLVSALGCDTIVMLDLTVLPIDTIKLDTVICITETPLTWYGNDYFFTGNYLDTLVPAVGCDTILVLNLTVTPKDTITIDTVICGTEAPFALYGKDYFKTDIYIDTLPALVGCDTIVIIDLTVLPIDTIALDTVICGIDAPFAWYGLNYYDSGKYIRTLNPPFGCDTILVLDITVLPIDTVKTHEIVCGMDVPYNWNGNDFSSTGIYLDTLISTTGCDSILLLDLTVLPIDTVTTDTIICISETPLAWYGNNYSATGIYLDTLVSATGCDSVLILDLTVLPVDTLTFDTLICVNETPFNWFGKNYTVTGIYTDTLAATVGCDTILILDIIVMPIDTISLDTTICGIEAPLAWNGKEFFTTGVYIDTLASSIGCDTIVILDLTVLPVDTLKTDTIICDTETPFAINGKNYFITGIYTDTLISVTGCDSVLILDLTVLPADTITFDTIICDTETPFVWYGKNYFTDGIYKKIVPNAAGCDTVALLNLKVLPKITDYLDMTICAAAVPFTWYGQDYSLPGIYHDTLFNVYGCDTVLTLDLKILPEIIVSLDTTICSGNTPFKWFGKDYFTTGIYNDTIFSKTGCDTLLELDLKILPEIMVTEKLTVCEGDLPYFWFGTWFNNADTVFISIPSGTAGCDTIRTLELQTIPEIYVTERKTIYESELPYSWFDEIFTQADTIVQILPSTTGGCDTIRTLELITIPGIVVTENITVCEDELPYIWFGETFANADTVVIIVPSTTGGSDTIRTLQLQTMPVKLVEISIVADRTAVCKDKPVVFTATTVNGGSSPIYRWFVNGKVVPGETSDIFTYNPRNGDEVYATVLSSLICATGNPAKAIPVSITTSSNITPAIASIGPFCQFSIAPPLPTTTLNGITGTWSPSKVNTNVATNNTYTFTPDTGQCAIPVQIDIEVLPVVNSLFVQISPLCQNSVAPLLPTVSANGIKGSWNPAIIDTDIAGTNTYTFTPDSGQCANPASMTIEILPELTPVFVQIGPLCQNTLAPALPLVSDNGISGIWSPAIIDTKNDGTFTFTFTPATGICANPFIMTVVIIPEIKPEFLPVGPLCINSPASLLPLVSNNGISGTWNPAVFNTSAAGTTTYTFTPDAGICAAIVKMDIEITDKIKPVFVALGPFCQNSIAPSLPLISDNGIHGTWLPDTILTDTIGTLKLVFTPDSGECAVPVTIDIEITDKVKPLFAAVGPLCQNSPAPALPPVSVNGITGVWSPALIDTKNDGMFTYTFTPSAGLCAVPVDLIVEVTPEITPEFSPIGPLCQKTIAPLLPLISKNGIKGTWSPAVINTAKVGTFDFKFTPVAGQCAVPVTMKIEITDEITPLFAQLGPLCQNSIPPALPAISEEGITGTWTPDTINTLKSGTFTFKFTPDANQCAVPVLMKIEITNEITPLFTALSPLCPNSLAPLLPPVSTNGLSGTWNPAIIETAKQGTFTFTFTPDSGQCAVKTTLKIEISDKLAPVAICRNFTVYLDADGKATITTSQIDNGSNDNCELDTLYLSRYDFDCSDVGKNPVTLIAVDGVGLRDSCEAVVTVIDNVKPVVSCKEPFEIQLDENAQYNLTLAEILEDVSDACGIDTMYIYPFNLDCENIGLTTITLWAIGVNGDSAYCESQVTIYGNRAPTVVDDSVSTDENIPVIIEAALNDYDEKTTIDISSLSISIKPLHGNVSINPINGDLTYTPDLNFSGVDVLEYRICDDGIPCDPECGKAYVFVTVRPVNDKPVAVDDRYFAGCYSVSRNVLDNDYDIDSDNLDINTNPLTPPNHGSVIIDPDGLINYFPNAGFIGIDSFEYVICDNGIPTLCDTAKVYIEVDCNEETQDPLDCELFVPEGFSPNDDGIHDFFRIMCIHNYPNAKLMIFNRNGNLLWEKENYGNYDVWGDQYNAWWWGTSVLSPYDVGRQMSNGAPKLKVGNYVYVLQLGNGDVKNGTVMISY